MMLNTHNAIEELLDIAKDLRSFDLTWTLPVGHQQLATLRLVEQLANRLPIYQPFSQRLHFLYNVHTEPEVGLIGINVRQRDSFAIPHQVIDATPSYIVPGHLVEREGLWVALWHHPRKPPLLYPLRDALQRMMQDQHDHFLPILHECSFSVLPQSTQAILRLYRINCSHWADLNPEVLASLRRQFERSILPLI